jgi:lipopolysaccharide transport system permease protein
VSASTDIPAEPLPRSAESSTARPESADDSARSDAGREYLIDARCGSLWSAFREAWDSRGLLLLLVERDLKVRYRQAFLGVAWAILTPLLFTVVMTVVFGVLARVGPEGMAYAPFFLTGLLVWNYFNGAVTHCSATLLQGSSVLSRIYFPRLLLPLSNLLTPLVDLGFGLIVLIALLAWYGYFPGGHTVYLPAYFVLLMVMALGTGTLLGALNAHFRDVRHALPVVLRLWFFCTPIIYASARIPEQWRAVFALNPVVTVIDGTRAALLQMPPPTPAMIGASVGMAVFMLVLGLNVFHRLEKTASDVV